MTARSKWKNLGFNFGSHLCDPERSAPRRRKIDLPAFESYYEPRLRLRSGPKESPKNHGASCTKLRPGPVIIEKMVFRARKRHAVAQPLQALYQFARDLWLVLLVVMSRAEFVVYGAVS